jgi:hypothetical protein
MKIPSLLYGRNAKVKANCHRVAEAFVAGASLEDLVGTACLDTRTTDGLVVLDGPSVALASGNHFHCFVLCAEIMATKIKRRLPNSLWDRVYEWALKEPGRFLTVLCPVGGHYFRKNPSWHAPYVRALVEFWPVLEAEGARYSNGLLGNPMNLWDTNVAYKGSLGDLGVPDDKLMAPLPPGGIAELVRPYIGRGEGRAE